MNSAPFLSVISKQKEVPCLLINREHLDDAAQGISVVKKKLGLVLVLVLVAC
jgi:hypothetical protein